MIKVKTLVQFQDFLENQLRYVGDVFEVTKERLEEITTKGGNWVEVIKDINSTEDITKMKKDELIEAAKNKGISEQEIKKTKTKDDLVKLIQGEV